MTTKLPRGGNLPLTPHLTSAANRLRIVLEWSGDSPAKPAVDGVAYLLGANGKVRGDADMVFYNRTSSGDGALVQKKFEAGREVNRQSFELDLGKLDPAVERIAFCLAIHDEIGGVTAIGQLQSIVSRVLAGSSEVITAELSLTGSGEAALVMAEVYKRNGEWKYKSVGQGFTAGLAKLSENFGIVVAEAAQGSPPSATPAAPVTPGRSAAPSALYEPSHKGLGEITATLTWTSVPTSAPKPGLLGALIGGKSGGVDLDLCALYELSDGYRGVVQSLGGAMGAFNSAPFLELMGDARAGDAAAGTGEVIRINGTRWAEIRRILLYAMIFEGAPNWQAAQGRVSIRVPDQLPVGVKLDQNTTDKRACTIALLENVDGKLGIHKRVETFKNPRELDQFYNWGLQWKAGAKD